MPAAQRCASLPTHDEQPYWLLVAWHAYCRSGLVPLGLTRRLHALACAACGGVPSYAAPGPTSLTSALPGHAPASGCGLSVRAPAFTCVFTFRGWRGPGSRTSVWLWFNERAPAFTLRLHLQGLARHPIAHQRLVVVHGHAAGLYLRLHLHDVFSCVRMVLGHHAFILWVRISLFLTTLGEEAPYRALCSGPPPRRRTWSWIEDHAFACLDRVFPFVVNSPLAGCLGCLATSPRARGSTPGALSQPLASAPLMRPWPGLELGLHLPTSSSLLSPASA